MARETKTVGKDASVAPSTLEKGIEPHRPRRTKTRREKSRVTKVYGFRVNDKVWAKVKENKTYPEIWIEDPWTVWLLNKPGEETTWLGTEE